MSNSLFEMKDGPHNTTPAGPQRFVSESCPETIQQPRACGVTVPPVFIDAANAVKRRALEMAGQSGHSLSVAPVPTRPALKVESGRAMDITLPVRKSSSQHSSQTVLIPCKRVRFDRNDEGIASTSESCPVESTRHETADSVRAAETMRRLGVRTGASVTADDTSVRHRKSQYVLSTLVSEQGQYWHIDLSAEPVSTAGRPSRRRKHWRAFRSFSCDVAVGGSCVSDDDSTFIPPRTEPLAVASESQPAEVTQCIAAGSLLRRAVSEGGQSIELRLSASAENTAPLELGNADQGEIKLPPSSVPDSQ